MLKNIVCALSDHFGPHSIFFIVIPDDECNFCVSRYANQGNEIQIMAPDCIDSEDEVPLEGGNTRLIYFLVAGMLFIFLVKPIGFLIPATICGVGVAKSFDAPTNLKTISICLAITLAFWGLFSALLGVDLGPLFKLPF